MHFVSATAKATDLRSQNANAVGDRRAERKSIRMPSDASPALEIESIVTVKHHVEGASRSGGSSAGILKGQKL
jgi:hypothetical protein